MTEEKKRQLLFAFEYRPQFNQFLIDYKAEHNKRLIIKELATEALIKYIQEEYGVYLPDVEVKEGI